MRPCGELQGKSSGSFGPSYREKAKGFQNGTVGSQMCPASGAA